MASVSSPVSTGTVPSPRRSPHPSTAHVDPSEWERRGATIPVGGILVSPASSEPAAGAGVPSLDAAVAALPPLSIRIGSVSVSPPTEGREGEPLAKRPRVAAVAPATGFPLPIDRQATDGLKLSMTPEEITRYLRDHSFVMTESTIEFVEEAHRNRHMGTSRAAVAFAQQLIRSKTVIPPNSNTAFCLIRTKSGSLEPRNYHINFTGTTLRIDGRTAAVVTGTSSQLEETMTKFSSLMGELSAHTVASSGGPLTLEAVARFRALFDGGSALCGTLSQNIRDRALDSVGQWRNVARMWRDAYKP